MLDRLSGRFERIDAIAEFNQLKVLRAMREAHVSEAHLHGTTGYGYNDIGRDTLEKVYASVFGTEDALVRGQIICGTHALTLALQSNLLPGEAMMSPVGKPYDTLDKVIGIVPAAGSLREYGIAYYEVPLTADGGFDFDGIQKTLEEHRNIRLVEIQRSKGYAERKSFSTEEIGALISFIKSRKPGIICMVDNCYGEFVDRKEPGECGADMVVGSLIKNPGGGLAPVGGYIAGTRDCVERCAARLSAPGLGKEVGPSLDFNKSFFQGLFLAPTIASGAEKSAIFAASAYEELGFHCHPKASEERHDIIQAVSLGTPERLSAFCEGIQAAAPVDSFVRPIADDMPGYTAPVIMAAGAFVQGSSIELSADGPLLEPYTAYFQGGLTFFHGKYGIMMSIQKLFEKGLVRLP